MEWAGWDVRDLAGKSARIEIVDQHSGGWGHIDIDQIELAERPRRPRVPLDAPARSSARWAWHCWSRREADRGIASIADRDARPRRSSAASCPPRKPFGTKLAGRSSGR